MTEHSPFESWLTVFRAGKTEDAAVKHNTEKGDPLSKWLWLARCRRGGHDFIRRFAWLLARNDCSPVFNPCENSRM